MKIYRSINGEVSSKKLNLYLTTSRLPSNVPYLVANLWEWKRPEKLPSRRYSVYASPQAQLAQELGGCGNGTVYQVKFEGNVKVAQIKHEDSRYHPECRSLIKILTQHLQQSWVDSPIETKNKAGRLWMPCLSKTEIETIFNDTDTLKEIKTVVWNSIKYWEDARLLAREETLSNTGEIFFEAFDGYYLRKGYAGT